MARYNDSFNLNTADIALIESTLREGIEALARDDFLPAAGANPECRRKIRDLEALLGKLHNQKIWYGQVHHTGVPLG